MPKKHQPVGTGMVPTTTELGAFIRKRRLELGLRQVDLSAAVGLPQNHIGLFETGKRKYLTTKLLERIAIALDCKEEELRKRAPAKHVRQPQTELGILIRSRREALGLSVEAFAKKMGVTPERAKELELKKSSHLAYELIRPLAKALKLKPKALVKFVGIGAKDSVSEFGRMIRERRGELGISLRTLAKELSVSSQMMSLIELGKSSLCQSDETIKKLARILKLRQKDLNAVRPARRLKQKRSTVPLAAFLIKRRLELHVTLLALSKRAHMAATTISRIERGTQHPDAAQLKKLADALDCTIPPNLIPSRPRRRKIRKRTSALGRFVTMRRLELGMNQRQLAYQAGLSVPTVRSIELERADQYSPHVSTLKKLSRVLACDITHEFIQHTLQKPDNASWISVLTCLWGEHLSDLKTIKELSGISVNEDVIWKALNVLRRLLEKKHDGYDLCLTKNEEEPEVFPL